MRSLGRAQIWFTLLPGVLCSSPLIFMWLAGWAPALGYLTLVTALPALLISAYFLPAVALIRAFREYEPSTLKGGSLLPLPADSAASWALVLAAHAALVAAVWGAWRLGSAARRRGRGLDDATHPPA